MVVNLNDKYSVPIDRDRLNTETISLCSDLIPVRNGSSSVGCRKAGYCQCNVDQCWFGHDPCNCERHFDECSKNEYLEWNGNTGSNPCKISFVCIGVKEDTKVFHYILSVFAARCVKCPQGFSTPTAGCGPCYKLPSIDAASEQTTASTLFAC